MKNIPLIILSYNQPTYLKNLINWWKFYNPENEIIIVDNASTYLPLLEFYKNPGEGITILHYTENNCRWNLKKALEAIKCDYYVVSDCDIMPCPDTPPNFLEIFKYCIDRLGYHHVGFCLKIDDLPDFIDNKPEILANETGFWNNKTTIEFKGKEYTGYRAPIDTTLAMYKKSDGWENPMPVKKWDSSLRIFNSYHLAWYLSPDGINEEMYNYFKTARYRIPGVSSTGVNNYRPKKPLVKHSYAADIITQELEAGAIYNDEYTGFHADYLVLHCLLKIHKPKSLFEIGTNMGTGTKIICNAIPEVKVYSLDLPTELAHVSLQHPISEGKGDRVGSNCDLPFTQLRGNSMSFDFSQQPCEAYFIDGEHTEENVFHETTEVLKNNPKLIVWHDADMQEVYRGILRAFQDNENYELIRVADTRIMYALKK